MSDLYFITTNKNKAEEVRGFLKKSKIRLTIVNYSVQEILSDDVIKIVEDEVVKAYEYLGKPCAVEHGILKIKALQDFPGGLSKVVWNQIGERLCSFLGNLSREAKAISAIAYCNGRKIFTFVGEADGHIAKHAKGNRKFYWDQVFIPVGSRKTYAQMTPAEKVRFSQAAKAWQLLIKDFNAGKLS